MSEELQEILIHPDYENELIQIIRSHQSPAIIRELLEDYHDSDLADVLELLTPQERLRIYKILGIEATSEMFAYLEEPEEYIEELDEELAADILENMDADDAADILEELDEEKKRDLERLIDKEAMEDISLIQSYEDEEIGSQMTTNYIVIRKGSTIKKAMRELVSQAADNDNISTLYVINEDETFYGAIELTDLIIARQDADLEDLIRTSYPYVFASEKIEDVIEDLKEYSEDSIPVLGSNKELLGVITSQDLVEIVDEEMEEDYAMLAGLTSAEDLDEPLKESVKKRIPWLSLLLVLGLFSSSIVGLFENIISELTLIVCFQSLVLGMAGNSGTQSLAVTLRVLMDEELSFRQKLGFVGKEIRVGFTNGALLAFVALVLVGAYLYFLKGNDFVYAFATSGCIGLSLIVTMVVASLLGTLVPMLFKKLGFDPAVASGPLITTINDLIAVVTYYGLAWIMLLNIFHIGG